MKTWHQKLHNKRKKFKSKNPGLLKNPFQRARYLKNCIITPRKPNSALRKCGQVLMRRKKKVFVKIAGSGLLPQKFAIVLVRGGGYRDTPGVRYSAVRGVYDCISLYMKTRKRSIYGVKQKHKLYVRKNIRHLPNAYKNKKC